MDNNLGILSYKNNSGIGNIAHNFEQYLGVEHFFVVKFPDKPLRTDWLNGTEYIGTQPLYQTSNEEIRDWFRQSKIDKLLIIETPFNWKLFDIAQEFGIEVFALVHWECFDPRKQWHKAKGLISNTKYGVEFIKGLGFENIQYIPYPVDVECLKFRQKFRVEKFLYVYGYGGVWDRKNLGAVIEIQKRLHFPLVIKTQVPLNVVEGNGIEVRQGDIGLYQDLYIEGDILLYPTKFEGLGLVILEAMACGLPVITTDAPPMNEYIKEQGLLVFVKEQISCRIYTEFQGNLIDSNDFEDKIKKIWDSDISELSYLMRQRIEKEFSWEAIGARYKKIFGLARA